jgi:hypothetical protein
MANAVFGFINRCPFESILASLRCLDNIANSIFQHTAQRMPLMRLATIASPFPEPPITIRRSYSPRAMASAAGRMKSGYIYRIGGARPEITQVMPKLNQMLLNTFLELKSRMI